MRILELLGSGTVGTAEMGPISTVVCELSNRFAEFGHEVTVADAVAGARRPRLHPRVRLVEVPARPHAFMAQRTGRLQRLFGTGRNTRTFLDESLRALRDSRFDAIHVHRPGLAVLLRRRQREPYFYTAHTPTWCLERVERRRWRLRERKPARLQIEAIRHSASTIALGPYLQACCPEAPVVTIPNGLDLDRWRPVARAGARRRLGIAEDAFVLVFAGRVAPVKGVDVLVEAVRSLAPRLPQLRVLIIGAFSGAFNGGDVPTPYAREVVERAHDLPIEFLGRLHNTSERYRDCLSAADVAVVPSRTEPFGLVAIEALAMGLPVIASDTGGLRDVVVPEVGRRVRPGDPAALANAIESLRSRPKELARMRESSRTHVAARFTWERVAMAHLDLFSSVLRQRRSAPAPAALAMPLGGRPA